MCNKASDISQQEQPDKRKKLTHLLTEIYFLVPYTFSFCIADVTVHSFSVSAKYMNIRRSIYN